MVRAIPQILWRRGSYRRNNEKSIGTSTKRAKRAIRKGRSRKKRPEPSLLDDVGGDSKAATKIARARSGHVTPVMENNAGMTGLSFQDEELTSVDEIASVVPDFQKKPKMPPTIPRTGAIVAAHAMS